MNEELATMRKVWNLLAKLSEKSRHRVVTWLIARLDDEGVEAVPEDETTTPNTSETQTMPGDAGMPF